jgi:hypothetical protein
VTQSENPREWLDGGFAHRIEAGREVFVMAANAA